MLIMFFVKIPKKVFICDFIFFVLLGQNNLGL